MLFRSMHYYEDILHCISINRTDHIRIGEMEIHLINNKTHCGNMTFYVITEGIKKVLYACCDVKPFVHNELYYDADVLIIGLISDDGILKDGSRLEDAPFRRRGDGQAYHIKSARFPASKLETGRFLCTQSTTIPFSANAVSRRSMSLGIEIGSPQAAMALATSFRPLPVTTETTVASGEIFQIGRAHV